MSGLLFVFLTGHLGSDLIGKSSTGGLVVIYLAWSGGKSGFSGGRRYSGLRGELDDHTTGTGLAPGDGWREC